jgi:hypothetical protein
VTLHLLEDGVRNAALTPRKQAPHPVLHSHTTLRRRRLSARAGAR